MKLVFISMVSTPLSGSTLRAALAMATSNTVIKVPPWITAKELSCSAL